MSGDDTTAWYALRTRGRHEKVVDSQLASRGIEAFLPLVTRRHRWADRWKEVALPLFPGFCFARFCYGDHARRLAVLKTVGVVELLGINGHPTPVPDAEIDSVRTLVSSVLPIDPHPYLKEGMEVEVVRGPLEGMRGIMVRKGKRARLVVSVHLIQHSASVELDADDVVPVRQH